MTHRLLVALIFACVPLWVGAANRYMACDCSLDGDGTASVCAASGGGVGAWNTPASLSLSAGDTLTASGTCYARMSITGGSAGNVITYAAPNGVTLDSSVSVNGALTFTVGGSPATYGSGSSWQLVSGTTDIYKKGSAVEYYLLRENGQKLNPRSLYLSTEAEIVAALKRGEWTVRNATTDSLARTIYYRPTDAAAPDTHTLRANRMDLSGTRGMLQCNAQDYWRMTGSWTVQYHHVNTTNDGAVDIINCDNYDTGGALTSKQNLVGANIDGGSSGVFNATLTDNFGLGLAIEGATATLSSLVVKGRYDYNGNAPRYNGQDLTWNNDADGIGIGHGGGTINGLVIDVDSASYNGPQRQTLASEEAGDLDRGSGLYVGTSNALTLTNLYVIGGVFRHNHRYAMFLGDESVGWTIIGTLILDTYCNPNYGGNGAVRTQALASGTPVYTYAHNVVWGNTCYGGASFATSYASATWNIRDNVFGQNQRVGSTWFGDLHLSGSTAVNNETNNAFYNTLGEHPWRFASTTYATLAEWQTITVADSGGANDVYANPDFLGGPNPTTPEGFRPDDDSPLCAAAYYTPPIAGTYYDGQRFGQRPDIGALGCAHP